MSAVGSVVVPLYREGLEFWSQLISECKRQVEAINSAIANHGQEQDGVLTVPSGEDLRVIKSGLPSTTLAATLNFHSWGPVIRGSVRGWEDQSMEYFPHEFELTLARDLDGAVVAIYDEGRSFSPRELACYLTQNFRRCFPALALPC